MRVCQPGPVAFQRASTSGGSLRQMGVLLSLGSTCPRLRRVGGKNARSSALVGWCSHSSVASLCAMRVCHPLPACCQRFSTLPGTRSENCAARAPAAFAGRPSLRLLAALAALSLASCEDCAARSPAAFAAGFSLRLLAALLAVLLAGFASFLRSWRFHLSAMTASHR